MTEAHKHAKLSGDNLIDVPAAAERCGVHPITVRRWIKAGALRAFKLGGQLRIDPQHLDALITASEVVPGDLGHAPPVPGPRARAGGLREVWHAEHAQPTSV